MAVFLGEPQHDLGVDEVLGAAERHHSNLHSGVEGTMPHAECSMIKTNSLLRHCALRIEPCALDLGYTYRHAHRRFRRYLHTSEGTDPSRDARHRPRLGPHRSEETRR